MSELLNARNTRNDIRWRLLTTASIFALVALSVSDKAQAGDEEKPLLWIELGGQLERISDGEQLFAPDFLTRTPRPAPQTISPFSLEGAPQYSKGEEAKITFVPGHQDWSFSAALRYGRSNGGKHVHQQSYPASTPLLAGIFSGARPFAAQFVDTTAHHTEDHAVLDFEAGKDVGLGLFGRSGSSTLSVGIRFAQFHKSSQLVFRSDPDWHFSFTPFSLPTYHVTKVPKGQPFHSNYAQFSAKRSFRGVGPTVSWDGSAAVVGSPHTAEIAFDWGAKLGVLFGRQNADVAHQTAAYYHALKYLPAKRKTLYHYATPVPARSHTVVVPNIEGFAGVSFKFPNANVSLGYRADFFFGAMDGGIVAAKKENQGFYGPFASVSVGLGG